MSQALPARIERKWVEEDKHVFCVYPSTQMLGPLGPRDEATWLELAQFYCDDLVWLLSLDHHRFWSHMIYSDKAREFLVSFFKESPPSYLKSGVLVNEHLWKVQNDIEHLVCLVYLRLCSKNEVIKNLGKTLYNNYLFTVPVLLDLCLTYGTNNRDLIEKIVNEVISLAPDFLEDLKEIVPYFLRVLRLAKDKFSVERLPKLTEKSELKTSEVTDFVYYLHDSIATVEIFLDVYPKGCELFRKTEHVTELVYFYANVLPEVHSQSAKVDGRLCEVVENTRVDLLKMVKRIIDFVLGEKTEESVDEYLTFVMELLPEPAFLTDCCSLFSLEEEIKAAVKSCANVDTVKVKHVLDGIALAAKEDRRESEVDLDDERVKLNSLVTQVKDILPHLENDIIKWYLKFYNNNTEKVIAAVLENYSPNPRASEGEGNMRVWKAKHESLHQLLNDREEVHEMRERFARLAYVDDTYDDEYDDTYEENLSVAVKETAEESVRRPFVTPRVLRGAKGAEESEEDGEEGVREEGEEEDEGEEEEEEEKGKSNHFVENPEVVRERMEQRRREKRNVVGRGRWQGQGQGQSRQVTRSREYKEAHKSQMANHNRKKQASRKMNRGLIPS